MAPTWCLKALATTLSPVVATTVPKPSLVTPSAAVSSAVWVALWGKKPPDFTNTYAAPWRESPTWWLGAPATAVSPAMSTAVPSWSLAAPSEAVSTAL